MTIIFDILILCKYSYFVFRVTPVGKKEYEYIKELDALEEKNKEKVVEEVQNDR